LFSHRFIRADDGPMFDPIRRSEFMHLKFKGVTVAVMAFLLGAAVVYAMPNSIALSATKATPHHGSRKAGASVQNETPKTEAPDTEAKGNPRGDASSTDKDAQGTHGAAVSALAHCAIKGAEHGALVSSVATMADATVAGSTAACTKAGATIREPGGIAQGSKKVRGSPVHPTGTVRLPIRIRFTPAGVSPLT
jgi:hypothetical protein